MTIPRRGRLGSIRSGAGGLWGILRPEALVMRNLTKREAPDIGNLLRLLASSRLHKPLKLRKRAFTIPFSYSQQVFTAP